MNFEKQTLNRHTQQHFAMWTLLNGFRRVVSSWCLIFCFIAVLLGIITVLEIWRAFVPEYLTAYHFFMSHLIFWMNVPLVLYCFGNIKGSKQYYGNFVRIGFVNDAGEAPVLISRYTSDGKDVFIFYSKGLIASEWQKRTEEIQSALNLTIGSIKQGFDYRTVIVRAVPPNMVFGKTIMWDEQYINYDDDADIVLGKTAADEVVHWDLEKMPHALFAGSTSCGKTRLAMVVLLQAVYRGALVYIIDLKGLDYYPLEKRDARIVTSVASAISILDETIREMNNRLELFRAVHAVNYRDYIAKTGNENFYRVFILIDEASMLTDSGITKEAKEASKVCLDKMATIVRMGRCVGIHMIVATQVPEVSSVPTAIRDNLDCKVCGKASKILSTMVLGDGRADEKIPKDSKGRFIMANGAEDIIFQAFYFDE